MVKSRLLAFWKKKNYIFVLLKCNYWVLVWWVVFVMMKWTKQVMCSSVQMKGAVNYCQRVLLFYDRLHKTSNQVDTINWETGLFILSGDAVKGS